MSGMSKIRSFKEGSLRTEPRRLVGAQFGQCWVSELEETPISEERALLGSGRGLWREEHPEPHLSLGPATATVKNRHLQAKKQSRVALTGRAGPFSLLSVPRCPDCSASWEAGGEAEMWSPGTRS